MKPHLILILVSSLLSIAALFQIITGPGPEEKYILAQINQQSDQIKELQDTTLRYQNLHQAQKADDTLQRANDILALKFQLLTQLDQSTKHRHKILIALILAVIASLIAAIILRPRQNPTLTPIP